VVVTSPSGVLRSLACIGVISLVGGARLLRCGCVGSLYGGGSRRAPQTGDGDLLGRVALPRCFWPPWGRAVKTWSTSAVTCSFLAWISLVVGVMVAEGLGDGGYPCTCFRYRLCLSLHVSLAHHRLDCSDVFRWCLELVMYFILLSCGGGRHVCNNHSFILIRNVRGTILKKNTTTENRPILDNQNNFRLY
jgi:hypothetical protein